MKSYCICTCSIDKDVIIGSVCCIISTCAVPGKAVTCCSSCISDSSVADQLLRASCGDGGSIPECVIITSRSVIGLPCAIPCERLTCGDECVCLGRCIDS